MGVLITKCVANVELNRSISIFSSVSLYKKSAQCHRQSRIDIRTKTNKYIPLLQVSCSRNHQTVMNTK